MEMAYLLQHGPDQSSVTAFVRISRENLVSRRDDQVSIQNR